MARSTAYDRVRVAGVVLDKMTAQYHQRVSDKMFRDCGVRPIIVQGSYNTGGVAASAGTHDGGGAIDYSIRNLTATQARHLVKCCRYYGGAAWHRYAPPFSGPHVHVIVYGNDRASAGAKRQVTAYLNGRDGLAGNRTDRTWRPKSIRPFKYVEPVAPKPSPSKQVDRRIDQLWHVAPGEVVRFRAAPSSKAKVLTVKTRGTFRFDLYEMEGDRKWLRLKSINPRKKWANTAPMERGRA